MNTSILNILLDTLVVKMDSAGEANSSWLALLTTILVGLGSATIATIGTLSYKKKEIDLQKKTLAETILTNKNELKVELIKIQDLRKEYELSLRKFDYERFEKVLEFSKDNNDTTINDKIEALKYYTKFLNTLSINMLPVNFFEDGDEYQEYIGHHTESHLKIIYDALDEFIKTYPHIYIKVRPKLVSLRSEAENLPHDIGKLAATMGTTDIEASTHFITKLFDLWNSLHGIHKDLTEDFKELEDIRRDYIKSMIKDS